MKLYGLANCDTVRKTRKKLESEGVVFEFIDTKKNPPTQLMIEEWVAKNGMECVINQKSRTWKQLSDEQRHAVQSGCYECVEANPALLKRPMLMLGNQCIFGQENILKSVNITHKNI